VIARRRRTCHVAGAELQPPKGMRERKCVYVCDRNEEEEDACKLSPFHAFPSTGGTQLFVNLLNITSFE
jgi:hypothetical protein